VGIVRSARGSVLAAVIVLASCATVVPAYANSISATGTPDFVAGTVPLVVTADAGVTGVMFEYRQAGDTTRTAAGVKRSTGTFTYDLPVRADTNVVARAFRGATEVWSRKAHVDYVTLLPGAPALTLATGALVRANTELRGTAATHATTMTIQSHAKHGWVKEWTGAVSVGSTGAFVLPSASLPGGSFSVRTVASNGFGSTTGADVPVYNLGAVHAWKRLVLVDKSSCRLYVIVSGAVTFTCRCAIGMPWTPTPTGTFRLGGRHKTPNAVWGPWRLPLSRRSVSAKKGVTYSRTRYFIHGTNDPGSIGHMRSHGCVRLQNKNIRKLSTRIHGYMAIIRE
jgi:hypothetical protein